MSDGLNLDLIAIDTETTGLDTRHSARPFLVTVCDGVGNQVYWEWDVDPFTRMPSIPPEDIGEIRELVMSAREIVGQNIKFDVHALVSIGVVGESEWPWEKTQDTLLASHLLASNQPHDLTSLGVQYLGVDITPYEERLKEAVEHGRRKCRSAIYTRTYGEEVSGGKRQPNTPWGIAAKGRSDMPSAKTTTWKYDQWLPAAMLKVKYREPGVNADGEWDNLCADYANADSALTVALWPVMWEEIRARGLEAIYLQRLKCSQLAYRLECSGVTVNGARLDHMIQEYTMLADHEACNCLDVAASKGYDLQIPDGATNDSLRGFCLDVLQLPPLKRSKQTGSPSLDSATFEHWSKTLPEGSEELRFVRALLRRRKVQTAVGYLEQYRRFWLPLTKPNAGGIETFPGWYRLHPSMNPTGTDTLRWSGANPNPQSIGKQELDTAVAGEEEQAHSLRHCFGPAPGREWWSLDAKNIELRIPAYEADEREFIGLFERPNDPPYFGSNHLLVAHILHKDLFEECKSPCECVADGKGVIPDVKPNCQRCNGTGQMVDGRVFKKTYASSWYQWIKNGNFAVQYGAVEQSGTADMAYHVQGAQARIAGRFARMKDLNNKMVQLANRNGYVETIPDVEVDPSKGYPILCSRTENGGILPTVPLNYHVQGTAMWWTMRAMIKVQAQLDEWRKREGFDGFITLQVHDELVLDFPLVGSPQEDYKQGWCNLPRSGKSVGATRVRRSSSNLWRIRVIQRLMQSCGDAIGIPIPVGCEYHTDSWAEGVSL